MLTCRCLLLELLTPHQRVDEAGLPFPLIFNSVLKMPGPSHVVIQQLIPSLCKAREGSFSPPGFEFVSFAPSSAGLGTIPEALRSAFGFWCGG